MSPTILIVGATGNTGRSVVETLSDSISTNKVLAGYRIIALTRSSSSSVAQKLANLPNVSMVEKNWVDISSDWLRENNVVKAFIASHNEPTQFADESTFHLAALHAGVKYVVRISTTSANVRPDFPAYYPRQHWAVETLLESPAFEKLQWTSLQPNVFTTMALGPALELIKQYRKDGKQDTLALILDEDAPVGCIHPDDVGRFAAVLLSQEDHSVHNKAKYVLNGPEDITGKQIVELVEQHIGTKVKNVSYKDLSFIDAWAASVNENKSLILSIKHAPVTAWEGKCSIATTSKEVNELAAPRITPAGWLKSALES